LKTDGGPVRWITVFQDYLYNDPTEGFFTAKPTHSRAVFTLWVYIPTHLPVLPFESLLPLNQYPKEIAGGDITKCLAHAMYAIAFKAA